MYLARKYNFQANELVVGSQLEEEFDQIYHHLSGVSGLSSLIKTSDNFPILSVEQLTAGQIAVSFRKLNNEKVSINYALQININVDVGVAPISVVSTVVCPNLNAQYLDGLVSSKFLAPGKRIYIQPPWIFEENAATTSKLFTFITPAGSSMKLISALVSTSGDTFDNLSQTQGNVKLNDVSLWTWTLLGRTPTTTQSFSQVLVENDRLDVDITSVDGAQVLHQNVTIFCKIEESFIN